MPNGTWEELLLKFETDFPASRILIIWGDGTLTPRQRTSVQALHKKSAMKIVAFTDSARTRGAMKALEWFGIPVEVFSTLQLSSGLETLGSTREQILNVRMAIRELERGLNWRDSSVRHAAIKPPESNVS